MSLEDRFRQTFDDAIAEVRTRLETAFAAILTDVQSEAERDKSAALAALDEARAVEKATELAAAEAARMKALAAADAAQQAAVTAAKGSLEAELLGLFHMEKETLAASHQSLVADTRSAAEADLARLRDESEQAISALRNDLEMAQAEALHERNELQAALAQAQEQAAAELATVKEQAAAELAQVKDQTISELTQVKDQTAAELTQAKDQAAAELTQFKEQASADLARVQEQALTDTAQARHDGDAALAAFRTDNETAMTMALSEAQAAAAAHGQALDAQTNSAQRLLDAVRALDGASSLTEVLDALTFSVAKEAGRSAMLVVKGERLIGWRTANFGALDDEPRSIESSTTEAGALAAAVNTGRPAVVGTGSVLAAPAFCQLSPERAGLAVPMLVAGRAVAVLYADTADAAPLSSAWTSPVEVLVRHAGRCLEAMAVSRGAHAKVASSRVGTPA